jgi:hypothetical protein
MFWATFLVISSDALQVSNGNSFTCILPASHCQSKPVLGCGTVSPAVITGICCETKPVLGGGTELLADYSS